MTGKAGSARRFSVGEAVGYAATIGAVWLAWEVVKAPVAERAPPELAVRLAPASPEVLRRAAEAELVAGRVDNARALSAESLARAPFNARALRVRGLAEAREGDVNRADEMLTLAGNWSLRDDPAHAWLVEHRLRRGDYSSSFAHADTLARRRVDLYPVIFPLFSTAATDDPRALPVLANLLAADPPWRQGFLEYLHVKNERAPVAANLAILTQRTRRPFTDYELQRLYTTWLDAGRAPGVRQVRQRLNRPAVGTLLQNGDFSVEPEAQIQPFGWKAGAAPGIGGGIAEDDVKAGNRAYRVEYDGFGSGVVLEQLVMLEPGAYVLTGRQRTETAGQDPRLTWTLTCAEGGAPTPLSGDGVSQDAGTAWRPFSMSFSAPAQNCSLQWLRLIARPGERRTYIGYWLDDLVIRRLSSSPAAPGRAGG